MSFNWRSDLGALTDSNHWSSTIDNSEAQSSQRPGLMSSTLIETTGSVQTYTPPFGTKRIVVWMAGGGGGGGGAASTQDGDGSGSGGGGAGSIIISYNISSGDTASVSIGLGGSGGLGTTSTIPVKTGGDGNDTIFAMNGLNAQQAHGGHGGWSIKNNDSVAHRGGTSGNATVDDSVNKWFNYYEIRPGSYGGAMYTTTGPDAYIMSGFGGASMFGPGAASVNAVKSVSSFSSGIDATSYGAGGSGAVFSSGVSGTEIANGGAGKHGVVLIYEYGE